MVGGMVVAGAAGVQFPDIGADDFVDREEPRPERPHVVEGNGVRRV